jgi:hypothetical protein
MPLSPLLWIFYSLISKIPISTETNNLFAKRTNIQCTIRTSFNHERRLAANVIMVSIMDDRLGGNARKDTDSDSGSDKARLRSSSSITLQFGAIFFI